MTTRLHVASITSIGAVEAGDNPEADILFYKRHPSLGRGRENAAKSMGAPLTPAQTAAVTAKVEKQNRQLADLARSQAAMRKTLKKQEVAPVVNQKQTETQGTAQGIVEQKAADLVASGEQTSMAKARAAVWKQHPDLVALSRADGQRDTAKVPADAGTLQERIVKAVHLRAAYLRATPAHFDKTEQALRPRVWGTPEGQALRELYSQAVKQADSKVAKAASNQQAMAILKAWETDPAQGLT
jgi:hypothetical protein